MMKKFKIKKIAISAFILISCTFIFILSIKNTNPNFIIIKIQNENIIYKNNQITNDKLSKILDAKLSQYGYDNFVLVIDIDSSMRLSDFVAYLDEICDIHLRKISFKENKDLFIFTLPAPGDRADCVLRINEDDTLMISQKQPKNKDNTYSIKNLKKGLDLIFNEFSDYEKEEAQIGIISNNDITINDFKKLICICKDAGFREVFLFEDYSNLGKEIHNKENSTDGLQPPQI
jgi:biopolymer transport protein ExbD